jgi:gluconate kinase
MHRVFVRSDDELGFMRRFHDEQAQRWDSTGKLLHDNDNRKFLNKCHKNASNLGTTSDVVIPCALARLCLFETQLRQHAPCKSSFVLLL